MTLGRFLSRPYSVLPSLCPVSLSSRLVLVRLVSGTASRPTGCFLLSTAGPTARAVHRPACCRPEDEESLWPLVLPQHSLSPVSPPLAQLAGGQTAQRGNHVLPHSNHLPFSPPATSAGLLDGPTKLQLQLLARLPGSSLWGKPSLYSMISRLFQRKAHTMGKALPFICPRCCEQIFVRFVH